MNSLYLLRHAHAGDPAKWHGDDALRPLSERGKRQAERIGRLLAAADEAEAPDLLITSPRVRAAETAQIVGRILEVEVLQDERLAGPLDPETVMDIILSAGPSERPCLVGHDPDLSELLGVLTGAVATTMRKGTLARIDSEGRSLAAGRGSLRFLVPPELLGAR